MRSNRPLALKNQSPTRGIRPRAAWQMIIFGKSALVILCIPDFAPTLRRCSSSAVLFVRTRNDEHGGRGLSSTPTTVTNYESSAPDTGESDARNRRAQQRRDSNRYASTLRFTIRGSLRPARTPVRAFVVSDSPCFAAAQPPLPCGVVQPVRRDIESRRRGIHPHPSGSRSRPPSIRCHVLVASCARVSQHQPHLPGRPSYLGAPAPSLPRLIGLFVLSLHSPDISQPKV